MDNSPFVVYAIQPDDASSAFQGHEACEAIESERTSGRANVRWLYNGCRTIDLEPARGKLAADNSHQGGRLSSEKGGGRTDKCLRRPGHEHETKSGEDFERERAGGNPYPKKCKIRSQK